MVLESFLTPTTVSFLLDAIVSKLYVSLEEDSKVLIVLNKVILNRREKGLSTGDSDQQQRYTIFSKIFIKKG